MPTILGANSVSGYEVSNSLRFNAADSAKLSFTQGTPTSRRTWTYSTWVKRGNLADQQESILSWGDEDFFDIRFQDGTPDDGLLVYISDGDSKTLATNRLFRDPSAWYHIVVASDTTDGTAGDRTRIYVNGVEETSFASEAQPDQNYDYRGLVSGDPIVIGNRYTGSHFFDGYLADTHFIDGQQLAPSNFGETNDNGVWIPKKYLGTYGTNGFKLEYKQTGTSANASGIGADTSGNDNHLAVTNLAATDITTDTPTNNFITVTPLGGVDSSSRFTFTEGNTVITQADNGNWRGTGSTIALTSGKWYWEVQNAASASTNFRCFIGVIDANIDINNTTSYDLPAASLWYNWNNGEINTDGTYTTADYGGGSSGSPIAQGDTLGVLLNMDDDEVSFFKNGSALVEGFSLSTNISTAMPFFASGESADTFKINFGNPAHSISSTQADDNGYGNFEYDVPAGYYAICTKNLAEYG